MSINVWLDPKFSRVRSMLIHRTFTILQLTLYILVDMLSISTTIMINKSQKAKNSIFIEYIRFPTDEETLQIHQCIMNLKPICVLSAFFSALIMTIKIFYIIEILLTLNLITEYRIQKYINFKEQFSDISISHFH